MPGSTYPRHSQPQYPLQESSSRIGRPCFFPMRLRFLFSFFYFLLFILFFLKFIIKATRRTGTEHRPMTDETGLERTETVTGYQLNLRCSQEKNKRTCNTSELPICTSTAERSGGHPMTGSVEQEPGLKQDRNG